MSLSLGEERKDVGVSSKIQMTTLEYSDRQQSVWLFGGGFGGFGGLPLWQSGGLACWRLGRLRFWVKPYESSPREPAGQSQDKHRRHYSGGKEKRRYFDWTIRDVVRCGRPTNGKMSAL